MLNQIKEGALVMAGDLHTCVDARYARIYASGMTIAWDEMRNYLEDRLAGKAVARPIPRKLARCVMSRIELATER